MWQHAADLWQASSGEGTLCPGMLHGGVKCWMAASQLTTNKCRHFHAGGASHAHCLMELASALAVDLHISSVPRGGSLDGALFVLAASSAGS